MMSSWFRGQDRREEGLNIKSCPDEMYNVQLILYSTSCKGRIGDYATQG